MPTEKQVREFLNILVEHTDWKSVTRDDLQKVINGHRESGRQFTQFIKNGGRLAP
jgi:hypothetical protein